MDEGYGGFCDGHEATEMESDGESRILHGWFYRPVPKSSSAGEITATKTEMSVACEIELVFRPDLVETHHLAFRLRILSLLRVPSARREFRHLYLKPSEQSLRSLSCWSVAAKHCVHPSRAPPKAGQPA